MRDTRVYHNAGYPDSPFPVPPTQSIEQNPFAGLLACLMRVYARMRGRPDRMDADG